MATTDPVLKTTIWNISLWRTWSQETFFQLQTTSRRVLSKFCPGSCWKACIFNISEDQLLKVATHGASPNIRPYLLMAQPSNLKELLQLPVVQDEGHLLDNKIPVKSEQPPRRKRNSKKKKISNMFYQVKNQRSQILSIRHSFKKCCKCNISHFQTSGSCPAFGRIYYRCHKYNHFARCCKTHIFHEFHQSQNDSCQL